MGSKSEKAPPPPDTSKYSNAAYGLGQQSKQWAQEMWNTGQQEWQKIRDWTGQYMDQAFPAMEDMFGWAAEQRDRYEQWAVPAMESLFTEAETYASKGEEDRQRAMAVQDVRQATEAQREAQKRRLDAFGVDPTELTENALDRKAGIGEAAASALAANQAAERTKQVGRDLRAQAINVGQGLAQQANQATGMGTNIGATGLSGATGAAVGGSQVAQGALPYVQGGYAGYDLGAGIVDTSYGRKLEQVDQHNRASQQDFNNMMAVGQSIGGMIQPYMPKPSGGADGGPVSAPGGPTDDAGAIAISNDEYIIPADVVKKLGTNYFDKMIEKETGRPPPSQKQAIPLPQNPAQGAGTPQQGYAPTMGVIR